MSYETGIDIFDEGVDLQGGTVTVLMDVADDFTTDVFYFVSEKVELSGLYAESFVASECVDRYNKINIDHSEDTEICVVDLTDVDYHQAIALSTSIIYDSETNNVSYILIVGKSGSDDMSPMTSIADYILVYGDMYDLRDVHLEE